MNTAAKRIHDKYHGNDSKIKLSPAVVIAGIFCLTVITSALVAVNAADKTIRHMIKNIPDVETIYVQETGKYPDWFLDWMNTEYLPGIAEQALKERDSK